MPIGARTTASPAGRDRPVRPGGSGRAPGGTTRHTQHDAQISALHVLPDGLDAELTGFARAQLRYHPDQCADAGVVGAAVRHGNIAHAVDAEATDYGAALLVVGAHGRHWLADPFLGSTPENLVRVSRDPVLVIKNPPERGYRTVVLGVVTSPVSATAAHTASALTAHADHIVVQRQRRARRDLNTLARRQRRAPRPAPPGRHRPGPRSHREPGRRADTTSGTGRGRVQVPRTRLPELSRHHAADLVALGAGGLPFRGTPCSAASPSTCCGTRYRTCSSFRSGGPTTDLHTFPLVAIILVIAAVAGLERWFGKLTTKKLQRGTDRSVRELNADNRTWIENWNQNPRPYIWTKTVDQTSTQSRATAQELTARNTRPSFTEMLGPDGIWG